MQTGLDFCRALLIHEAVSCPQPLLDAFLDNMKTIYNHYKNQEEANKYTEKNQDVVIMKIYEQKLAELMQTGQTVNTLQIRKALLKALRQTEEVFSDNET